MKRFWNGHERGRLLRFSGWFAAFHALMMIVIGSLYLLRLGWPEGPLAQVYTITALVMHFSMMAFLPWGLVVVPLVLLAPRYPVIRLVSVTLLGISCAWLLLDSLLYLERQFHINHLTLHILDWHTWAFGGLYLVMFGVFGTMISGHIWAATGRPPAVNRGKWVGVAFFACYVSSQGIHAWADANYYVPVTRMGYTLPLYHPLTAKGFLTRHGLVDLQRARERRQASRIVDGVAQQPQGDLNYPVSPLQCPPQQTLNLLVILVDALRADMLTPEIMPNLSRFSEQASRFQQHYSGGNSSRMGVFSIFYGLPANYWKAVEAVQRPPVMMDELQRRGYQFGIFGSAPLHRPVSLDRTAFSGLSGFRVETPSPDGLGWQRDQRITEDWLAWLEARDPNRPFFGFLFYDGPTSKSYPPKLQPWSESRTQSGVAEDFSRYQASVRHNDQLIQVLLADLANRQLLENTVVLVTADHGHEFDDSGLGFKGHGSAYNRFQLQVPFLLHWPGREPQSYIHRTSHSDWVVSVMSNLFGCTNPPSDYTSMGKDLFVRRDWSWLIAGSYHNFAVISPAQVIISHLNGSMEVRDSSYRLIESPNLNKEMITRALDETTRFFKER